MAVENSEAPGGKHQQPGAGEQDAHEGDRQCARGAVKTVSDDVDQKRRGEDSEQNQRRGQQGEDGEHGPGNAPRFFLGFAVWRASKPA